MPIPIKRRHKRLKAQNIAFASRAWSHLSDSALRGLAELTTTFGFSLPAGDVRLLDGNWYVTHGGLLRLAQRRHCRAIDVEPIHQFCHPNASRWAFRAIVRLAQDGRFFVAYGDADPSNVSPLVRGAEMRVAETRAVNRALRKAYGIGLCSVEELGSFSGPLPPAAALNKPPAKAEPVNGNGDHPLRDRLCLLMRQHQLDPAQVKAYAAHYCGVSELRQASREQVVGFVKHLAEYVSKDREGLFHQLNSYALSEKKPAEGEKPESHDKGGVA